MDSTELVVIFLNSDLELKIISAQHAGGGAGMNAVDGFLHHQRAEQRCVLQTHHLKGSLPVSKVKMLPKPYRRNGQNQHLSMIYQTEIIM